VFTTQATREFVQKETRRCDAERNHRPMTTRSEKMNSEIGREVVGSC